MDPIRIALSLGMAVGLLVTPVAAWAQPAGPSTFCAAGEQPAFRLGFAALKQELGARMGNALECEHTESPNGDTTQRTTTGLAYLRGARNTVTFTNGSDHWMATPQGLAHWVSDQADPPPATEADIRYMVAMIPIVLRLQNEMEAGTEQLSNLGQAVQSGAVGLADALSEMQTVQDSLTRARNELAGLTPSPRLGNAHVLTLSALDDLGEAFDYVKLALEEQNPVTQFNLIEEARTRAQDAVIKGNDANADFRAVALVLTGGPPVPV